MPDISMCEGADRELCKTCYRTTAIPHLYRQAWFTEAPLETEERMCEYYWNDEGRKDTTK